MQPLIVVGFSARAAAASAVAAGYQPWAIDAFADRDLQAIGQSTKITRYPAEILRALWRAPDAPWIYTGGLENYPRLIERLAALRPLCGNGGNVVRAVRDVGGLAPAVEEAGFAFPRTRLTGGRLVGKPSEASVGKGRWLVKPARGSGGIGIRSCPRDEVLANLPPRSIAQQCLGGEPLSAVYLSANGGAMLVGTSRQLTGRDFDLPAPFLYAGSIAPAELSAGEILRLEHLGAALTRKFGLVGLWNIDLLRAEGRLWVLEVNPRYSASVEVIERLGGDLLIRLHMDACLRSESPARTPPQPLGMFAGKAIAYARAAGVLSPRLDELIAELNRPGERPAIADLPCVSEQIEPGHPIATVFANGDTATAVQHELQSRVAAVEATLDKQ